MLLMVYFCGAEEPEIETDAVIDTGLVIGSPLVGMSLLYSHRLTIDVVDGGTVQTRVC